MVIQSDEIIDLISLRKLQSLDARLVSESPTDFTSGYHDKIGKISFKNSLFPHMHIMNLRWQTAQAVEVHESVSSENININFHVSGNLDTRFAGIGHELNMRPAKHNLVFSPEGGFVNKVGVNASVEMFHVSLEKNFFLQALGCNNIWSEMVHRNIQHNRPFSGITGTLDTTPNMQRLIHELRESRWSGPMRNLMIQSKILELLALQMDQFSSNNKIEEALKPGEQEKLLTLKMYLETHFLEDLSLTELSRVCLLNEFKLKKGFKALFGETVFGYVRKLRMDYAQKLLLDCSMTVEEVSDVLGYEHAQHFSTAFKKYAGVNPSQISGRRK
ncbi:helix-turn-helix transcriptional regulator [Dyadobacter luticola]|uniref:Helix-turn-helix transcriptional regulator n=1 Tax=Dyadobacter luticola TaxID=1979387 RepID=A0A5R9L4A5_9BACT|nr:AraC family transcriptional regulator [Dyadobacter luticola]TLV03110.1 helix-turn-helix transcriptional regulator [Dyadobacter luticola]